MDIEQKTLLNLLAGLCFLSGLASLVAAHLNLQARKKYMPELTTDPNAIEITKVDLYNAFLLWEANHRAGNCLTPEQCLEMPVEQQAEQASEHFWTLLLSGVKA